MKKRAFRNGILLAAAWLLLLILLVYAEGCSSDATITSLPLAFWYSLVTMTTVGYGDLYPVTAAGKIIGGLFLLLSAGALTALITCGVTWLSGTGLPKLRLKRLAGRKIYVFDGDDSASEALAAHLAAEEPEAVCVFAETAGEASAAAKLRTALSVPEVLKSLPEQQARPVVLYLGDHALEHLNRDGRPDGVSLVCRTEHVPEELKPGLRFFDRSALCASMYWQENPLQETEASVLLVGFGSMGRAVLEYALENNVFSPVRVTQYHVFGSDPCFTADHPCLKDSISLDLADSSRDSLFFHSALWNADETLLLQAGRIIFCSDSEEENLTSYDHLRTYFPYTGKVSVFSTAGHPDAVPCFGTDEEIYTPEAVLRSGLERLAQEMHEIYREECGGSAPAWEELSSFLRRSNFASAQHVYEKVRYLLEDHTLTDFTPAQFREAYQRYLTRREAEADLFRRIEHERWVRFHTMYNWRYAAVRNNALRRHPLMVPFEELSPAEQVKDDYAWELIGKLAERFRQT